MACLPPALIQRVLVLIAQSSWRLEPYRKDSNRRLFCRLLRIPLGRCCDSDTETAQRCERLVNGIQLSQQLLPLRPQQTDRVIQIDHAHPDTIPDRAMRPSLIFT